MEGQDVSGQLAEVLPEFEWAAVRTRRDQLLRATDFTQLLDFPATSEELAEIRAYRQSLRDIPESGAAASSVVWPDIPAFFK